MLSFLQHLSSAPAYLVGGDLNHVLADAASTRGACSVMHVVSNPGGGPPPHAHEREDEVFFVLEGEVTFLAGDKEVTAGPGTSVFAHRGERHTYRNNTNKPVRMLVVAMPGGIDVLFREVGRAMPAGTMKPEAPTPQEIETLIAACPRYGIRLAM